MPPVGRTQRRRGRPRRDRPRRGMPPARCGGTAVGPRGPWACRAGSASAAGRRSDEAAAATPVPEKLRVQRGPSAPACNRSAVAPVAKARYRAALVQFARRNRRNLAGCNARQPDPSERLRHARCIARGHARPSTRPRDRRLLRSLLGVRALLRAARRCAVSLEYAIGLAVAVLLGAYLPYALLAPERFQP